MTVEEWVEGYRRAWEQRDADAAAALFSDDSEYRTHAFLQPLAAARQLLAAPRQLEDDLDAALAPGLVDRLRLGPLHTARIRQAKAGPFLLQNHKPL